jgi:hypothetical protein
VLSAALASNYRAGWLVSAAVPALVLGLVFYVLTAARFDLRELLTGQGDHWVAGGALAISALAASKITEATGALGQFREQHQVLTASTLVLWVFPLGMYAACSFATGQVTGISGIAGFGHVWTWVVRSAASIGR